ncbi:Pyridoxal-dependent decarboxylase domain-containing protein 1 [Acropora cervicornis]|uniref:Pyridoxal-dependent decarboxylase domain-containing protein 1 n=1 Tax=Acropora cervicornis TaxID=6130 RepID=A0AAD9R2M1_ACRCE|nr:Pyridoxal-dependent decarboxylase domain-containing protein 1 [Acropora cervicornis]
MADARVHEPHIEENELLTDVHEQSSKEKTFGESEYLRIYEDLLQCVKSIFELRTGSEEQCEEISEKLLSHLNPPYFQLMGYEHSCLVEVHQIGIFLEINEFRFNGVVSVTRKTELSKVLCQISDLVIHEKPQTQFTCAPDSFTHTNVIAATLSSYLSLLDESCIKKLSACIKSDCSHWLAKLFGLALRVKYPKFGTEGFTALYTSLAYHSPVFVKDIAAFERLFNDDVSCGKTPLLLIAYAGTPVAGHTDNVSRLRELCTQNGLWLHMEGDTLSILCLETVPVSLKAEASGLSQSHEPDRLSVLSLWISLQTVGMDKMREMILHSAQLAQQMSISLDGLPTAVKRIAQDHCMSPVIVFKYKAAPVSPVESSALDVAGDNGSDADDEQDYTTLSSSSNSSSPDTSCVSSSVRDSINQQLARYLAQQIPSVKIGLADLPKEGYCIRFNPVVSSRICGTTSADVEDFVICLKNEVTRLDAVLLSQEEFRIATEGKENVTAVETQDTSSVGALLCVPNYWTNKEVGKLRDAKKVELNEWNKEVLALAAERMPNVFSKGRTDDGLTCIIIEQIPSSSSVDAVVDNICKAAVELESSSKYLEQMENAIQKGIEAAEQDLVKDAEEKLLEEGLLRQVPLVSSLVNWLSPLPEEPKTVGRTFNLTSGEGPSLLGALESQWLEHLTSTTEVVGNLQSTETIYKYYIQVQEEEDNDATPVTPTKSSPGATPTKQSPSPTK